jgi:hypothetical protein
MEKKQVMRIASEQTWLCTTEETRRILSYHAVSFREGLQSVLKKSVKWPLKHWITGRAPGRDGSL